MLVLLITLCKYIFSEFDLFMVLKMAFRKDQFGECFNIGDIRDHVLDDHPCHLIWEVVGRMDFTKWEDEHGDTCGNPAYHPRVILRPINFGVMLMD